MATLLSALTGVQTWLQALDENAVAQNFVELRQSLTDPVLRVVIFGEFNRGKSTLINALLGRLALPTKLIPTTGHVTSVVFGQTEEVRVQFLNGVTETCRLEQLDSFSSLTRDGLAREDIKTLEVALDAPMLRQQIVLIDTPGVNERETQTLRAKKAITAADIVLMMLDARQLLNSMERELAVEWLCKSLGKPVLLVVNFMNFVDEDEKKQVRTRLNEWCRAHLPARPVGSQWPWLEVNALGNLAHILGLASSPADDFDKLRHILTACQGSVRKKLQRRSRYRQLLAEVRETQVENQQLLFRLRASASNVARERAALRDELQEQSRRLDANAATESVRLSLLTKKSLDAKLELLAGVWFKGKSKQRLKDNANRWYQEKLSEAICEVEKQSDDVLLGLAGKNTRRPQPMTIKERMILNARLSVGELPLVEASGSAVRWGMGVGAAVGTAFVPIIGTVAGALIGVVLASIIGASEPDYAAAYSAQAREKWNADALDVTRILKEQLDVRLKKLKQQLNAQLEKLDSQVTKSQPAISELQQREALDDALKLCANQLESVCSEV